ncbi:hypothetical protein SAMN02745704_00039 [Paucidesulfovibrio gracilis DSM 16080]|uniref:Uncharacterized protein n=1 Tax=Paucidesulfovibrio gracilis DSM 16080 TaxID=1121449 RepID=A0A1T4W2I9_9BACT|nr:hypothetical protein [Paucidesulfovibrio gracilis]SKA70931.1 hypothetical protein SAMN02745704_00039 [Paucidesulfovibrio gracilis DSM 16080]
MQRQDKTSDAAPMEGTGEKQPLFRYENGRIYFTRRTERMFFFLLTVAMLVLGVVEGVGVFGGGS